MIIGFFTGIPMTGDTYHCGKETKEEVDEYFKILDPRLGRTVAYFDTTTKLYDWIEPRMAYIKPELDGIISGYLTTQAGRDKKIKPSL